MNIFERAREAWTVFRGRDHPSDGPQLRGRYYGTDWTNGNVWGNGAHATSFTPGGNVASNGLYAYQGPSSSDRPDRLRLSPRNEKTILASVFNRIALDVADVEFHHAKIDENDMFKEIVKGSLEDAMTVEANLDQAAQAYMIDLVLSMFDEGVVAEVPVECDRDKDGAITDEMPLQMRTARIAEWRPKQVRVNLYNELTGRKQDVDLEKREVCIIENPFYSVMNQRNGIFDRLSHKMALLDAIDEKLGSDKLNMVVQLPYIIRTDQQRATARARIQEMQDQLSGNKLGITYVDGTEKVIQLNRPIETNLQSQIEWLTDLFLSQLCITKEILNGTADAKVMANYKQRCVAVICTAIVQERRRKLLTAQQRKNGESIVFVQDPFKLTPVTELADLMDKSIRGSILTPNEWRSIIGYKPSDDKTADMLMNRNMPMNQTPEGMQAENGGAQTEDGAPVQLEPMESMQHSAIPNGKVVQILNRAQRRRMSRSKVPRDTG